MRFYYVEPPVYDGEPEGEDGRQWFARKEDARREYVRWRKELLQYEKDRRAAETLEGDERYRAFNSLTNWQFAEVEWGYTDLSSKKHDILNALNHRVPHTIIESFEPETKT